MALIKCSECGKEVSDKASQCIHCGNPLNQINDSKVIVYGITQQALIGGTLQVLFNGEWIGEVKKQAVLEFPITKDGVVSVNYGMKRNTGKIEVKAGQITSIKYEFSGYSGQLVPKIIDSIGTIKSAK